MFEPFIAASIASGARLLTNPHTRWLGCEAEARQRIYYANHTSHLDFVLLWSALPAYLRPRTRPVAASDYWDRAKLHQYMIHRVFRGVLVHRRESEKQKSISLMLQALDRHESLIVFPEGMRGSGQILGAFKSGLFHLAYARPWIDLVPVWISNCSRVLPKGAFLPVPMLCSITFGPALHIEPEDDKDGFLHRLRRELLALETR